MHKDGVSMVLVLKVGVNELLDISLDITWLSSFNLKSLVLNRYATGSYDFENYSDNHFKDLDLSVSKLHVARKRV
jgi:hypothetical protein